MPLATGHRSASWARLDEAAPRRTPNRSGAYNQRIRFADATGNEWTGYTDGTHWNGFANVVMPEKDGARMLKRWLQESGGDDDVVAEVADILRTRRDEHRVGGKTQPVFNFTYGYAFTEVPAHARRGARGVRRYARRV